MQAKFSKSALSAVFALGLAAGVTGCASTESPAGGQAGAAANKVQYVEEKSVFTGSRIPSKTTEKLVKSTTQDKADEPVRSIGNTVGFKGN